MKMIVGLGNPGIEYQKTRHNVGFMVIDSYVGKNSITNYCEKFNGLYVKMNKYGETFLLLKPYLYMNLSGKVVKKFADYYRIKPEDILIIHDDLDLPVGKIKIKYKGSSGGHNGIKNIIENLHCENFPRFKVGISKQKEISIKDYVISNFTSGELEKISKILSFSDKIIDDFIKLDIERVMSKYNGAEYEIK